MNFSTLTQSLVGTLILLGNTGSIYADFIATTQVCDNNEDSANVAKRDKKKLPPNPFLPTVFVFNNLMEESGNWRGIVNAPDGQGFITPVLSKDNPVASIEVEAECGYYTIEFLVLNAEEKETQIGFCSIQDGIVLTPDAKIYKVGEEEQFTIVR